MVDGVGVAVGVTLGNGIGVFVGMCVLVGTAEVWDGVSLGVSVIVAVGIGVFVTSGDGVWRGVCRIICGAAVGAGACAICATVGKTGIACAEHAVRRKPIILIVRKRTLHFNLIDMQCANARIFATVGNKQSVTFALSVHRARAERDQTLIERSSIIGTVVPLRHVDRN